MVIPTGMMESPSACVLALKVLQNSMMLTPCCPSAGPTGGAGLAFPAGICSLTIAVTTFAIGFLPYLNGLNRLNDLNFLHLQKSQLHRRGPAEDANQHLDLGMLLVHLIDDPVEPEKRAVDDPHVLALLKLRLAPRLDRRGIHLV